MTTHRLTDEKHAAKRRSRAVHDSPRSLPIDEIYERYPGEWVVVKVTGLDEHQRIARAEVLAHSPTRGVVSAALVEAHRKDPTIRTYVFFGGRSARSVEEWREQLAQTAELEPLNAFW
jgi:hypothetical protein